MIITVSGMPGSGKSTLSKYISRVFNLKYYGMGELRREMALKKGMSIDELNKFGEKNPITDIGVDNFLKTLSKKDNLVVDGRMAFHFIPNSIKIFVHVDPKVGAERISKRNGKSERYASEEKTYHYLKERIKSDAKRYKKYYGIDVFNLEHYDIILDSTYMSLAEARKTMKKSVEKFIKESGM